ncbi:MAG: PQQ-like beta-propeller repeat protein [Planctomycetes bacterium]|nr:PQQ-like beta-propeller repeat protein [Planctomycetota bacterium]
MQGLVSARRSRAHRSWILVVLASCGFAAASAASQSTSDETTVAPAGTWSVRGGPAARTGVSASRPLCDAPQELWTRNLAGAVVDEPLLATDGVFVETLGANHERTFTLFDLRDGAELWSSTAFVPDVPLEPSLAGDLVAVRSSLTSVDVLRRVGVRLELVTRIERGDALASPLLCGTALLLRCAEGIECLDARTGASRWREYGRYRGALAVHGDTVHAVRYDDDGRGNWVKLELASGTPTVGETVLWHDGQIPEFEARGTLEVFAPLTYFHAELPIPVAGQRASFGTVANAGRPSETITVLPLLSAMTAIDGGCIGAFEDDDGPALIEDRRALHGTFDVLADREHHAALVRVPHAVSVAGPVGYVGGLAFELATRRVLWRRTANVTQRMVPTDGGVLLVEGESRLVHLGRSTSAAPTEWLAAEGSQELKKATLFLHDGTCERRDVALDREQRTVRDTAKKKAAERRLTELVALEDAEQRLIYTSDASAWIAAVERAIDAELAQKLLGLAKDALAARDGALARRLHDRAANFGGSSEDSKKFLDSLTRFLAGKSQPPVQNRIQAIVTSERELERAHSLGFATRLERLVPSAPNGVRDALARALLAHDPKATAGRAALTRSLPASLARSADADLDGALELSRVLARYEGAVVEITSEPDAAITPSRKALARAAETWRKDLLVIRTPRLLVLGAPEAPRTIARALAWGELVGRGFEAYFVGPLREGPPLEPLVICAYDTHERFKGAIEKAGTDEPRNAEPLFAHFDPTELVTHLAPVPEGPSVVGSRTEYAHAVAHHWLRERCPRFSQALARHASRKEPGYWIVEGFAGVAETFELDVDAATVRPAEGVTESLALIARLPSANLHAWESVFGCSRDSVDPQSGLRNGDTYRWGWLGRSAPISSIDIFRAQSTALVAYLLDANGGKLRPKLLDFAHAHYLGNTDPSLDCRKAFGSNEEALGDAVFEWASQRLRDAE